MRPIISSPYTISLLEEEEDDERLDLSIQSYYGGSQSSLQSLPVSRGRSRMSDELVEDGEGEDFFWFFAVEEDEDGVSNPCT